MVELVTIRLEKYKNDLVKEESAVVRGKAQEMRDLHKILTENGGN